MHSLTYNCSSLGEDETRDARSDKGNKTGKCKDITLQVDICLCVYVDTYITHLQAMIDTGAPTKRKNDSSCPFYYECNSWSRQQEIPWNVPEKRSMKPSEWIYLQSQLIEKLKTEINQHHTTV